MKFHLEVEALAGVAAFAAVAPKDALVILDESQVGPDDWTRPFTKRLAAHFEARLRAGQPLEFISAREILRPDAVETQELLHVLTAGQVGLAAAHLVLVRDAATRVRCVESLRVAAKLLKDEGQPLNAAVSEAQSIVAGWKHTGDVAPLMQTDVESVLTDLDDVYNGRRPPVVPTGIEALDAVIGGLQPTLTVVGALPGVGKSALVAALARNMAHAETKCGVVSLEDDRTWLVRRLVSDACGIGVHSMMTKRLGSAAMAAIADAAEKVHAIGKFVHIDGRGGLSPAEVVASARYMLSRGCKAILVDHLGEMRIDLHAKRHDLVVGDALAQLRGLANLYRVPVVVMAHLNREQGTEFTEPQKHHFAFSAAVERMARVALGLYRVLDESTGQRADNVMRCVVMKQTNGRAGITVNLRIKAASGVVTDSPASAELRGLYGDAS